MFSWFRKKQEDPPVSATRPAPAPNGNPGICVSGQIGFSNAIRSWTEHFDAVELAAQAMEGQGHQVSREGKALRHMATGLLIRPQLAEFQPLDQGGVRTVSTVEVDIPSLRAKGIFEFQHSTGDGMEDSLRKGFDQWAQVDLVPLLDCVREKPANCTMMQMEFPAEDGKPAHVRRAILGPVAHLRQNLPAGEESGPEAEHPFCACCLLTNTFEAFQTHMQNNGVYGIRLFAMRDQDGQPAADCRINGLEYEPGKVALRAYVQKWPQAGVEFRKQYVVLHTASAALSVEAPAT